MSMGRTKIGKFSDGEVTLEILDKVRLWITYILAF